MRSPARALFLSLILGSPVLAVPQGTHGYARYSPTTTVPVQGRYFRGQLRFTAEKDLRDCQMVRLHAELTQFGAVPKACFALYVTVQDGQGHLLGAEGHEQSVFPREPGWKLDHQVDLAMPAAVRTSSVYIQYRLIEDTGPLR